MKVKSTLPFALPFAIGDEPPVGGLGALDQLALCLAFLRGGAEPAAPMSLGQLRRPRIQLRPAQLRAHQGGSPEGVVLFLGE
jgi:hypothetical protein